MIDTSHSALIRCFAVISDISPTPIMSTFLKVISFTMDFNFETATLAIETGLEEISVVFLTFAAQVKALLIVRASFLAQ